MNVGERDKEKNVTGPRQKVGGPKNGLATYVDLQPRPIRFFYQRQKQENS